MYVTKTITMQVQRRMRMEAVRPLSNSQTSRKILNLLITRMTRRRR
eukprot:CAMPEP_0179066244 /NCGR_PEP_ID=MMETSP0796-20121207/28877_1 /TAXON_ID=73915 /ORGANISM="Pyrodinium bahamense, Strain pbaha01" /LENGTH=45 /DNA_ID= /DNA_START= /DNA_END= /DNA_ORIENTATION=